MDLAAVTICFYPCCGAVLSNRSAINILDIALLLSLCCIFVFIFNLVRTYHAASAPGSEQERLEYALNSKRKALILALRWANTHTYMLQEEPAAISFLEVTKSKLSDAVIYT